MKKTAMKIISTLLCLISIFSLSFSVANASSATDETQLNNLGDVNIDGSVTAADARLALRSSANLEKLDKIQTFLADVNKDGKVTAADARQILRVSAKLDVFRVNVKLEVGQEYVVDSVYVIGSYGVFYTVSPETGLDVTETIEELPHGTPEGEAAEQIYTFTAKESGMYEADFKFAQFGDQQNVRNEIVFTFTVK